jgi:hypothetical protein
MSGSTWTEEKAKLLTELWDGCKHSAAQIAVILGPQFNRNMVIGKAKRLKLKSKERCHYRVYGIIARKSDRPRKTPQNITAVVGGAMNRPAIQKITLPGHANIAPMPQLADNCLICEPDTCCMSEGIGFWQVGVDQCRFPLKGLDVAESIFDYRCCGLPITDGAYCAEHAKLCHRPANWR